MAFLGLRMENRFGGPLGLSEKDCAGDIANFNRAVLRQHDALRI
jgi:hypothetical protein